MHPNRRASGREGVARMGVLTRFSRGPVDEYFADKQDQFEWVTRARLHLVRK